MGGIMNDWRRRELEIIKNRLRLDGHPSLAAIEAEISNISYGPPLDQVEVDILKHIRMLIETYRALRIRSNWQNLTEGDKQMLKEFHIAAH